ncbi:MAG: PAC2 family protein [Dehalococcoidia bacterium]
MSSLTIHHRPRLRNPILVTAFLGWNDAAESASGALRYLRRHGRTVPFAEIDPDEFFVFTEQRPQVRFADGQTREIRWPLTDFTTMEPEHGEHDLILALGTEPNLRWKAFAGLVLELAREMQVEEIVTLGALLADTPHTRPVPLTGGASDPARAEELGFEPSTYEGPTGIVGALSDALRRAKMPQISLWASVPHYVSGRQNPRATLALLRRLSDIYSLGLDLDNLTARSRRYEAQVTEALKRNPEMQEYVNKLEAASEDGSDEMPGHPLRSSDVLREVDRLLRGDESQDPDLPPHV